MAAVPFVPFIAGPADGFVSNHVSPPPLAFAAAAYDASDHYVVLFGGLTDSDQVYGTTWIFSNANWSTAPSGAVRPAPRWGASMAFDAAAGDVVMFGGCSDPGCGHSLNDTWTYAAGIWTNRTATSGAAPPPRGRAMMTFDPNLGELLLMGGQANGPGGPLADAWCYRNGSWAVLPADPNGPVPRLGAGLAFDPGRNATILFGGNAGTGILGDTWAEQGGVWTNLTASLVASPSARWAGGMTFDSTDGYVLLVDGYDRGSYASDSWALPTGSTWTAVDTSNAPAGAYGGVLVDDPADGVVLYFSGQTAQGTLTTTMVFAHGHWTILINPPGNRSSVLVLLTIMAIVFVPLVIVLPLGAYFRRRREAQLASGVVVRPGDIIQWVPTRNPKDLYGQQIPVLLVLILLPVAMALIALPSGVGFVLLLAGIYGIVFGAVIAAGIWATRAELTRAVGLVPGGVIIQRKRGELRIAWENLQPSLFRPQKNRYVFQYLLPGKSVASGGVTVTVEQARAILTYPSAPAWVLAGPVATGLGLPTQRPTATVAAPPSPSPRASPAVAPGAVLPSDPWRQGFGPVAPGAGYAPVPAPPPPPPPIPPGMRACPRCGTLNAAGRVAFCRQCGQRLS